MLDDRLTFEKGRPVLVSGNTAAMLGEGGVSHMSKHFTVRLQQAVSHATCASVPPSSSWFLDKGCLALML